MPWLQNLSHCEPATLVMPTYNLGIQRSSQASVSVSQPNLKIRSISEKGIDNSFVTHTFHARWEDVESYHDIFRLKSSCQLYVWGRRLSRNKLSLVFCDICGYPELCYIEDLLALLFSRF